MYYICCIYVYIQQILQLGPVARAREMLLLQRGLRLLLLGVLGGASGAGWAAAGGQGRAVPLGHHTWENLNELASNENMHKIMICKYVDCICRICKKNMQ